jgi:transglutaminase-like putative cysteine protease
MRPHFLVAFAIFLCISSLIIAQPQGITIGKKNSWAEAVTYDPHSKPSQDEAASYYYLLIDEQENTLLQEDYYHYAYTILTSEGIQEIADLTFDFDPAYQQIILHEVKIIRGNNSINQLSKDIKVIQREQSMERYQYDGTKTAIINLKDIRVGDIVEYAFTRKGYNPVHKGHIARTYYFDFYESIDKYFKKLILPASAEPEMKSLGEDVPQPLVKNTGSAVHYTWSPGRIKQKDYETGTPYWFNTNRRVMISDFKSWKDVGEWAKGLFEDGYKDVERIKSDVAPAFKSQDNADYILEVIRFVQDEVRYLGFEGGINSHKPYPPMQVYEQRFGDCKDKSLLLITLLKARGIEAYPMLVNTSLQDKIEDRLPSGTIFDHCVVQIVFNNKTIYIDPTWSNQGGDLDHYCFPDYKRGLVIRDEISGLEELPEPESPTTTEIQNFELLTIGGEAMLSIRTSYTGANADYQRAEFSRTALETIRENYKQYHANLYPDITEFEPLTFTDDRKGNVFIVDEKYKIPTFWKPIENEEQKLSCIFQPMSITSYFDVPKNIQQRKTPYQVTHPIDFYHEIHVKLPEEWTIAPIDQLIENEFYQYEYTVTQSDNEIHKSTHYKSKSDHIPAENISQYVTDHTKMYNGLVYQLTFDKSIAEAEDTKWPGVLTSILTVVGAVFGCFALYNKYNPAPVRYMVSGSPIGGWLVLMAFGVVFSPIRMCYELVTQPELFSGAGWITWLAAKRYDLFTYTFITQVYNICKLLFSVLIVVLFFQRRTSFPLLMTIQLATSFIIVTADGLIAKYALDDSAVSSEESVRAFVAALIWIPYLQMSQRVKETFVIRNHNRDEEQDGTEVEEQAEVMNG